MRTDTQIKIDALKLALCYACFGCLGLFMFYAGINSSSEVLNSHVGIIPEIVIIYIPLVVGLGMFVFSWRVYVWTVRSDKAFQELLK